MHISPINYISNRIYYTKIQKQPLTKSESTFELSNVTMPAFLARYTSSICLIFEDDSVEKFDNCEQAAKRLGVSKEEVFEILRCNAKKRINGALCVYSDVIETKKPNSEAEFDQSKIELLKTRANIQRTKKVNPDNKDAKFRNAIYMVSIDGSTKMFNSRKEACDELGIPASNLSDILRKKLHAKQ